MKDLFHASAAVAEPAVRSSFDPSRMSSACADGPLTAPPAAQQQRSREPDAALHHAPPVRFSPGDHVHPKPEHLRAGDNNIPCPPSGKVRAVKPHGQGQIVIIEGNASEWFSGLFDKTGGE